VSLNEMGLVALSVPTGMLFYAYVGYPLLLWILSLARPRPTRETASGEWPTVSVSLVAYNEEDAIEGALDALMRVDYPRDRLQVLVTSDASEDRTDEVVRGYGDRGVELLRLETRGGKTAAENAAAEHLRGDIIISTDSSIRILPQSIKPLVAALADSGVGVSSGRDISVGPEGTEAGLGETGYVGYEMWVRSLESRLGSIIGASGCFYATRRELFGIPVPDTLSRDFAAVLKARRAGFRSVHVSEAVCTVPRTGSPAVEYRRKVRTMARGLGTLWHYRSLQNPFRYGGFAFALISHKLCRWLVPPLLPLGFFGVVLLALGVPGARVILGVGVVGLVLGGMGMRWPASRGVPPRSLAVLGFALSANAVGIAAWAKVFRDGGGTAIWEPTRRDPIQEPAEDPALRL